MMITQKINMHLDRAEANPRIYAVRGDCATRQVQVTLYENGEVWTLPEELDVTVLYRKSDGTEGAYDTLPDGTAAWSGEDNVLTVLLAPQMTTTEGLVLVQIRLSVGDAVLHSFGFYLQVSGVAADAGSSEDYFGWRKAFIPQITGAEAGQFIQIEEVDELGRVLRAKGAGTVPEYVRTAAETLARKVNSRAGEHSFSFALLADAHCGYYTDLEMEAVRQAAQALQILNRRSGLDFIGHGGDMALGAWYSDRESTFENLEDYAELLTPSGVDTPQIWCAGNHDDAPYQATDDRLNQGELFSLIGRRNLHSGAVCPQGCNYGYLDLENRKIRVIFLDTDDKRDWGTVAVGSGEEAPRYLNAHNIGGGQLQWLADTALDFTGKQKPGEWAAVVVSHVALNVSGTVTDPVSGKSFANSTAHAATILEAYRTGLSGSIVHNDVTVSYSFSDLSARAEVYCAVHGHEHRYGEETVGGMISIGCPNVMNGRERESDDGNTYAKTAGTAEGTSFCVITVDRENNRIYADHYGAGYDREWEYVPAEPNSYVNQIPISTDTDGSIYNEVGYAADSYLSSGAGTVAAKEGYYVTGFIPCAYKDVVRFANIVATSGDNYCRFNFYDADKNHIVNGALSSTSILEQVYGSDGNLSQITIYNFSELESETVAYFRFCCAYIGEDSIITVNQQIG